MKKKLFGTDGIRGKANQYPITPEIAMLVGKATAKVLGGGSGHKRVVLGKDTRISGYMLENAITSGLLSMGMDVLAVGPMPTPAVAHLTRSMGAVCGIMITASHNPACDNGIKIFAEDGFKLPDSVELEIEKEMLEGTLAEEGVPCENIGKAYRIEDARGRYIEYAKGSIQNLSLRGLRIVLDCANGAAYSIAPLIFRELGAEVIETAVRPDGLNINDGCGALYPENIGRLVREHRADAGIALDGDADRVIFCDANGEEVNGDRIIGMLALAYQRERKLASDTIVVTGMSNLGLMRAMKQAGINVEVTDVGDRYVIERMRGGSFNVGGEQSGHIIFMDYATTGDGIISALHVLKLMKQTGKPLAELAGFMNVFPQEIRSFGVARKTPFAELSRLPAEIDACREALGESGRTIVRYSGTENKIRILVEAEQSDDVRVWIERLSAAAREELN
ncbi:phosphoglucosamine mutase [Victivallaceae bacterium BBE-744-WT-12]|jgi:phosphoglucosamine mutase|uniref:Phosphoglucosamine mutase n=1 Tax=Victivallis lenta TaxID=2606640 RepID=A0A844FYX0_9BACT|nr:phosphoglucosamine mutase [Victivallis lenta]MBS1453947.1 phosphoglucosamine mutase [Lentisphaeria bacterium]MBS5529196.1 phosphoglucosamine mutase [bacterium]MST96093.1 phosphoglucosamine mutase [Victivallis lenta]HBP05153.1 phosphoglucosamine mutase [Lentisphaeria bacterium]HCH86533.1 phosphoglucosamine mutase [Lentisphaeria bacterium]